MMRGFSLFLCDSIWSEPSGSEPLIGSLSLISQPFRASGFLLLAVLGVGGGVGGDSLGSPGLGFPLSPKDLHFSSFFFFTARSG